MMYPLLTMAVEFPILHQSQGHVTHHVIMMLLVAYILNRKF